MEIRTVESLESGKVQAFTPPPDLSAHLTARCDATRHPSASLRGHPSLGRGDANNDPLPDLTRYAPRRGANNSRASNRQPPCIGRPVLLALTPPPRRVAPVNPHLPSADRTNSRRSLRAELR
ncbi:hypothetical protein Vafri_11040 [Volvox africanus]|uniref:Uncharacterized protein n=1 Tax=Volvox africanus TaxID=51714 RepID=A0A8J4B6X9_9CHLO|nr:hypothetical protein Vafri_11040 [Volvox africanus]